MRPRPSPHPMPRVLVVDDEVIVSMLVEDELTRAGFGIVGPFGTCAEADAWLRTETPDAAVLDVKLREGPCTEVAAELSRRSVPFVVFSGTDPQHVPVEMRGAPLISKPSNLDRLAPMLAELLASRTPVALP